jgi:hypothetical protein
MGNFREAAFHCKMHEGRGEEYTFVLAFNMGEQR